MTAGEMGGRADPALGVDSNNSPGLGNCCPARLQHAALPPASETGAWSGAELRGAGSSPSPSCWGGCRAFFQGADVGTCCGMWQLSLVGGGRILHGVSKGI